MISSLGMDKGWLNIRNRGDQRYGDGVDGFLSWTFSQPRGSTMIRCPCKGCMNTAFKLKPDVRGDLLKKSFWDSYKVWDLHGEHYIQAANIEASVSSAIEIVRQEMQADMDRKLQEEREQMAAELKRNMEQELQR